VLAARRKNVPEGQWITSMGGWHPNQWAEHRHPTRAELDEAVPDRPVFLYERFTGPVAVNSLAKQFFDAADAAEPVLDLAKMPSVTKARYGSRFGRRSGSPALYLMRRVQTFEDKRRSALDAMSYPRRASRAFDEVCSRHRACTAHPVELGATMCLRGSTYIAKAARAWPQMNLHNQNDPALRLRERLGTSFSSAATTCRTGAISEWAAPISAGPVWLKHNVSWPAR
jgi:hypothetical protein